MARLFRFRELSSSCTNYSSIFYVVFAFCSAVSFTVSDFFLSLCFLLLEFWSPVSRFLFRCYRCSVSCSLNLLSPAVCPFYSLSLFCLRTSCNLSRGVRRLSSIYFRLVISFIDSSPRDHTCRRQSHVLFLTTLFLRLNIVTPRPVSFLGVHSV